MALPEKQSAMPNSPRQKELWGMIHRFLDAYLSEPLSVNTEQRKEQIDYMATVIWRMTR